MVLLSGVELHSRNPQSGYATSPPLTTSHTPILPGPDWRGRSPLNADGDFAMQTDAAIGEIRAALDEHGLADDTLVVVTSDNGCSPQADVPALAQLGHDPSGGLRGHKADIYEGGHRVPFIVRWPGRGGADAGLPPVRLFDLDADRAETTNLQAEHPDVVARLMALLEGWVAEGRSTPGPRRENTVPVKIPRGSARP